MQRRFRWDRWHKLLGCKVPNGAIVQVVRFMARRRVIIEYNGEQLLTMLWCLNKNMNMPVHGVHHEREKEALYVARLLRLGGVT